MQPEVMLFMLFMILVSIKALKMSIEDWINDERGEDKDGE